jgi:hypothetical protein
MRVRPIRVYADTSVYGGVHDDEFREFSVNYDRIRGYTAVNLLNGFREVDIRTPREVLGDEDQEEGV